jgi:hypothetical protein
MTPRSVPTEVPGDPSVEDDGESLGALGNTLGIEQRHAERDGEPRVGQVLNSRLGI